MVVPVFWVLASIAIVSAFLCVTRKSPVVTIAPTATVALSYNALYNKDDYLRAGPPPVPAPDLKPQSDVAQDPRFVDPANGDFRLRPDSPLKKVGQFDYLGAFPPAAGTP